MPEKEYPQVSFRVAELVTPIQERTKPGDTLGSVAKRDLERYYHALALALRSVDLTEGEALLISDASNGTLWQHHSMSLLWAEVDDACALEHLDRKWSVDRSALVGKLRQLTLIQTFAICDAAERFWNRVADAREETNEERVRAVGLVR